MKLLKIWTGKGYLAFLVPGLISALLQYSVRYYFNAGPRYYMRHPEYPGSALLFSAIVLLLINKLWLNNKDDNFGQHTLFTIDLRFWPLILIFFALFEFIQAFFLLLIR